MRQHPGASTLTPLVQWSQMIGLWRTVCEGTTHCQLNWSERKNSSKIWGGEGGKCYEQSTFALCTTSKWTCAYCTHT